MPVLGLAITVFLQTAYTALELKAKLRAYTLTVIFEIKVFIFYFLLLVTIICNIVHFLRNENFLKIMKTSDFFVNSRSVLF